jgi:predicted RNA-binding protein
MAKTYWANLFSIETWREFRAAGANVSGFTERSASVVSRICRGDILLAYVIGVSRFVAVLEVTSEPYVDHDPIWKGEQYPLRVGVTPLVLLTPETGVPIKDLRDQLPMFIDSESRDSWRAYVRRSPYKWPSVDGEIVLRILKGESQNPKKRPHSLLGDKLVRHRRP